MRAEEQPQTDNRQRVQAQFGPAAAAYATSPTHAQGPTLQGLIDRLQPAPHWHALDVATGAGHTAFALAARVARVMAVDLTLAMLEQAATLAHARHLDNIQFIEADATALPFEENTFDAVCCRLAFHHFPQPAAAAAEMARVLKPGGKLGFVDNIVPHDDNDGDYFNAMEKLRDPSHHYAGSRAYVESLFLEVGLIPEWSDVVAVELDFASWTARQRVSPENCQRLWNMFRTLPESLAACLQPCWPPAAEQGPPPSTAGVGMTFTLPVLLLIARKARG